MLAVISWLRRADDFVERSHRRCRWLVFLPGGSSTLEGNGKYWRSITLALLLEGGQAFANAIFREPRDAPYLELVHDLLAVCLYRLNAQLESSRDILCRFSFRDQLKHLQFSLC